jgi:hypothetical protein
MASKTGLLKPKKGKLDFYVGGETGIVYKAHTDDWEQYRSKDEYQFDTYDSMSCVTYSSISSVEAQINYLCKSDKKLLNALKKLGYIENDKFEANEWFTAVMSGTTSRGNTLQNVADSIRKHGLLPNKYGFQLKDFNSIDEWLDKDNVSHEMEQHAKKFLELFDAKYEWVLFNTENTDILDYHYKQAPLVLATGICKGWRDALVPKCGFFSSWHATAYIRQEPLQRHTIIDTYKTIIKYLAWNYEIKWAMKIVVTPKQPVEAPTIESHAFNTVMWIGQRSEEIRLMQAILRREVPHAFIVEPTGYYGRHTAWAVRSLQAKYNLAPWAVRASINGRWTGAKTRALLTRLSKQGQ